MWCARRIRIDRCDGAMQERCEILGCEEQLPGIVFSVLAIASLFVWHGREFHRATPCIGRDARESAASKAVSV